MKNIYPVKKPKLETQPYSGNLHEVYNKDGMKGHGAIDFGGSYGDPIYAVCDSYVYSFMNPNGAYDRYRAVCTLVDEGDFVYEIIYGHVIDSPIPIKTNVKQGQLIARMGNYGDVYSGGRRITREERERGSKAGTHLHFQIRKCIKTTKRDFNKKYIKDGNGYVKLQDKFIEILDYGNGYNGLIDPQPFFTGKYKEDEPDLIKERIIDLQKELIKKGYLVVSPSTPLGFFGELTQKAVEKYQAK